MQSRIGDCDSPMPWRAQTWNIRCRTADSFLRGSASRERQCHLSRAERFTSLVYALLFLLAHGLFGEGLAGRPARLVIESGTPVKLQLAQTISSAHAHKSDRLDFVVTKDVAV